MLGVSYLENKGRPPLDSLSCTIRNIYSVLHVLPEVRVNNVLGWLAKEDFARSVASMTLLSHYTCSWCPVCRFRTHFQSCELTFLTDYLFGHYTRQDVEAFITRNTKSWGKSKFQVQVRWGYKQYIKADVVALELQNENSEMAYHAPVRLNGSGGRTLLKERSVPLGVPLGDMDDMEEMYADYVRDIAQKGLNLYHRAAYFEEDSAMVKKLFKIASSFYTSGLETGTEVRKSLWK
jgi:hypothetical protein